MGLFSPGTVWVLIPIAGILAGVFRQMLRIKEKQVDVLSNKAVEMAAQYAAQTERLEQRVRVLERIVTDKGMDLSAEIERLRDASLN
jgi:hypothetical protein